MRMLTGEPKIYLLLTDTGTMLNRVIKSYTGQPYNHASIAFDAELNEVYSFGRKTANNPFIGGFVGEDIHSALFRQAECAVYSLNVTPDEYQKMYRYIQEFAMRKERYRYNFIGLFGVMVQKPIQRKHAFFCSEFVASVLRKGKVLYYDKDPSLLEPSELPHSANFQLVFEGRVQDYYQTSAIPDRVHRSLPGRRTVKAAHLAGYIEGCEDGRFRGDQYLSRAERIKIANRLFSREPLSGTWGPGWGDVPAAHGAYAEITTSGNN
ncbi:hypothetical protein DFP94_106180 [Fontibacillus phaseoli]|uniref:SLH domain-containing protein n=1 Tax=Fontibacillus phaseoli TaxID=1416533 RepID=A0A369BDI2_9BACL|nr:hypothetical protein [Fontibacillus phaseoli]RCX18646.1 hypothetical protein DFP94_106180 [Fontibacillus phaseoli]